MAGMFRACGWFRIIWCVMEGIVSEFGVEDRNREV